MSVCDDCGGPFQAHARYHWEGCPRLNLIDRNTPTRHAMTRSNPPRIHREGLISQPRASASYLPCLVCGQRRADRWLRAHFEVAEQGVPWMGNIGLCTPCCSVEFVVMDPLLRRDT